VSAPSPDIWLISDPLLRAHDTGVGHPESPARLDAVLNRLHRATLPNVTWRTPVPVTREALLRIHTSEFVDRVDRVRGLWGELDPDVPVSPGSTDVAYLAAGAGIDAVTAVMTGQATRSFALTRPPGHHAERGIGLGFCMFNNAAIAAAHAREALGAKRVLLLDWDVHHGNGSQHLFEARNDILVLNIHQSPMYPGTGAVRECGVGAGRGYTVNVPLPAGMGDGDYAGVFDDLVVPIVNAYAPDLIMVSAGFDAHVQDPLGGMAVTPRGFGRMCASVRELADRHAGGRLCLLLEGGYDLEGLATSVEACVEVLAGAPKPSCPRASETGQRVIASVREQLARHWPR